MGFESRRSRVRAGLGSPLGMAQGLHPDARRGAQVSKRCVEVWKVAKKALRWNVLFFFDVHAVLFTVRIFGASSYETHRANDLYVTTTKATPTPLPMFALWVVTPHHVAHNLKHIFLKQFNCHDAISKKFVSPPISCGVPGLPWRRQKEY